MTAKSGTLWSSLHDSLHEVRIRQQYIAICTDATKNTPEVALQQDIFEQEFPALS